MNKFATITFALTVFLCSLPLCGIVQAGLAYWFTEIAVSPDNRFVLVSISDNPLEEELSHPSLNEFERLQIREIRTKYPESGLYRNDGSTKALWTYDGRWGAAEAIIAPDGEHVIFPGGWVSNEDFNRVVDFTRNGKLIRSYSDTEIIPQWMLKAVLNGFSPPACSETAFNPEQMKYSIRTSQGEEFVMDVTTGEVIAVHSPFPMLFTLVAIAMLVFIALTIGWWRSRRRQRYD